MTTYSLTRAEARAEAREVLRPTFTDCLKQLSRAKGARRDVLQRVVWRRLREAARET